MKELEENEIYIIQLALDAAKERLKNTYKEPYLTDQLISINKKLEKQLKDLEHFR